MKFLRILSSKLNHKIIYSFSPYFWPIISFVLRILSRKRKFLSPDSGVFDSSIILIGDRDPGQRYNAGRGIDLNDALENWLRESIGLSRNTVATSINGVSLGKSRTVLVVTHDWLWSGNTWRTFFKEIRHLAREARKRDLPVWVMIGDVYDQEFTIPAAILVALCGGSTILQSNTAEEGKRFGLIFPSGPHIWTMPRKNLEQFESNIAWSDRENKVLIARSGEARRISFMKIIEEQLLKSGWQVQGSAGKSSWNGYVNLVKSSQVIITTCWLQQYYIVGSKRTRAKIASNTVTHRVWEGFAAGACVVTNSNAVFDSLGFVAGTHYVELWHEDEPIENIILPPESELMKIAEAGHALFSKLVLGEKSK
jgi:hypothetical protein